VREIQRRYPPDPRGTSGPIQVARTGRVVFVAELTDDMLRASVEDPEHLELLRQVGMRSAMIVPLAVTGRVLGALTLITADSGRVLDDADLAFAQDLAQRAALALENARLYEQQRQIAHTLQTALLPDDLPVIPGLTMAARFVPHGDGIEVGGDLYDVFPSPDGWAIAVGDVCGKGPAAAGLTALVRHTLRVEVLHGRAPADALHQVNAAMLRHHTRGDGHLLQPRPRCAHPRPAGNPRPVGLGRAPAAPGAARRRDGANTPRGRHRVGHLPRP
jgi:hypothetical protein